MSSYSSPTLSSPSEPQHQNTSNENNPGALIRHPDQQNQAQGTLQPYNHSQPPYERQSSHQSHHSHHSQNSHRSHRSHNSHHSHRDGSDHGYDAAKDRELERRPTIGDTLMLIWGVFTGAVTGKRR